MIVNDVYMKIRGGKSLCGEVEISGSKNSISALIPAMCIGEGEGKLTNTPKISDIDAMKGILEEIGLQLKCENNTVRITGDMVYSELDKNHVSKIRASNLFLGVLLAKFGKAVVPISGGDKIGNRPIDIHLYMFNKFGIRTEVVDGYVKCESTQFPYKGQKIFLRFPSVGATENTMLVASAADSETIIYNAAMEPEVVDMAVLLNSMGVRVTGAGTPVIHIKPSLNKLVRTTHEVIPDRLETGTFMFMIAATKGKGLLKNVIAEHVMSVISILNDSGVFVKQEGNDIVVDASNCELKPINIEALPFPGFPTDLQAFACVYANGCAGTSYVKDMIFTERFSLLYEMSRMGMSYESMHGKVIVNGNQKLTGSSLEGSDIRMTTALIMAALIAEGDSKIYGLQHLFRGYDNFMEKLLSLGAEVALMDDSYNSEVQIAYDL